MLPAIARFGEGSAPMITPMRKQTAKTGRALGLGQASRLAVLERGDEMQRISRALSEALIEIDRNEILEQFDRAVVLYAKEKDWHGGLGIAREVYRAVLRWEGFDSAPYARTVAEFAHNYAVQLQEAGLFEAAEESFSEALGLFEKYGDWRHQMVTVYQLGRVRQDQGKSAAAEHAYSVSLEMAYRKSDSTYIGKSLFQLGQLAQLEGQARKAAGLYREVLEVAARIPSHQLSIGAAHQLGILAQMGRRHAEANRWFEIARARALESGDGRAAADALHQLGMVAHEQGDYSRAQEFYQASLAQAFHSERTDEAAPTLYQMAQAALAHGDFAAAANYGQQSLDLVQAQGNFAAISRVQGLMRRLELQRSAAAGC